MAFQAKINQGGIYLRFTHKFLFWLSSASSRELRYVFRNFSGQITSISDHRDR